MFIVLFFHFSFFIYLFIWFFLAAITKYTSKHLYFSVVRFVILNFNVEQKYFFYLFNLNNNHRVISFLSETLGLDSIEMNVDMLIKLFANELVVVVVVVVFLEKGSISMIIQ